MSLNSRTCSHFHPYGNEAVSAKTHVSFDCEHNSGVAILGSIRVRCNERLTNPCVTDPCTRFLSCASSWIVPLLTTDTSLVWWCIHTGSLRDRNRDKDWDWYYVETIHTGCVWDQDWTPENHWNIKTHHLKQLQDLKNEYITHSSLSLFRCLSLI